MRDHHLLIRTSVLCVLAACGFRATSGGATDAVPPGDADIDSAIDGAPGEAAIDGAIDAPIDAPPALCIQLACMTAGGTCMNGVCVIDENGQDAVTCPPGMPCKVLCDTEDACKAGGVNCGNATACEVTCVGTATCQTGGVDCGQAGSCRVRCEGNAACQAGDSSDASVECRGSNCDVTCTGSSACQDGIDVDGGGTCRSHCCNSACEAGFDMCINDNICT